MHPFFLQILLLSALVNAIERPVVMPMRSAIDSKSQMSNRAGIEGGELVVATSHLQRLRLDLGLDATINSKIAVRGYLIEALANLKSITRDDNEKMRDFQFSPGLAIVLGAARSSERLNKKTIQISMKNGEMSVRLAEAFHSLKALLTSLDQ